MSYGKDRIGHSQETDGKQSFSKLPVTSLIQTHVDE
jgi:hypothetical protein